MVRDEAVKLLSHAGGETLPEMMKAFGLQAHPSGALFRFFNRKTVSRSSRRRSTGFVRMASSSQVAFFNGRVVFGGAGLLLDA
jgi:hypothetical protein